MNVGSVVFVNNNLSPTTSRWFEVVNVPAARAEPSANAVETVLPISLISSTSIVTVWPADDLFATSSSIQIALIEDGEYTVVGAIALAFMFVLIAFTKLFAFVVYSKFCYIYHPNATAIAAANPWVEPKSKSVSPGLTNFTE